MRSEIECGTGAYLTQHGKGPKAEKISRYEWSMKDEPGILMFVPKSDLFIDDDYQRNVNSAKATAIAREWSWIACGAIIVADRDGTFFVIDGQNRVSAAMRRADIKELPCIIFSTNSAATEAEGFLRANTFRKPLTSYDKFRALITINDQHALFVQSLLDRADIKAGNTARNGVIKCLTIMLALAKTDRDILDRVWPVVCEICNGHGILAKLLQGICYLEKTMPDGDSLTRARWKKRLIGIGYDELLSSIQRAQSFYEQGGANVYASGVLNALNKGLVNRLKPTKNIGS